MAPDEIQPESTNLKYDDLEVIDGIGSTYAAALHKIGIHRFTDFAKYTPAGLSNELKKRTDIRVSTARIKSEKWIGKARDLASKINEKDVVIWQEYASFIVTFERLVQEGNNDGWRTKVYKTENGGPEVVFLGLDTTPWINWIFELGKLPVPKEPDINGRSDLGQPVTEAERSVQTINKEGEETSKISIEGNRRDEITIKRGGHDVTYKKSPSLFVVRAKTGKIVNEALLESTLGHPKSAIRHITSIPPESMEVFAIDKPSELEDTVDGLRESPEADVVSHVYSLDNTPGGEVIPTGSMTIQFQKDVAKEDREAILDEFGLEVVKSLDYLPEGYTVQLTSASKLNPLKIAEQLQSRGKIIRIVEPDLSFQVAPYHKPTDSLYPLQWHLNNKGDDIGLLARADVRAEEAWVFTRGSRKIKICIIDDGFDLDHPDFKAPGKVIAPRDFGQQDFDPNPLFDDDNHGTCCAGVAVAEENGSGAVGLAPECAFIPIRFSQMLTDNTIVDYFQYAMDHDADIISCSWSAKNWYFPLSEKVKAFIHKVATEGRDGKGCVILFAAGNETRPLNNFYKGRFSHQGFALHPDVIAVAASNSRDEWAHYSNYGDEIAICAPSSGAGGRGIVTTDRRGIKGYTSDDYRYNFGGTSSATPLAAGLAALILTVNENLTSSEVKRIMMETAEKIGDPGDYVNGHSQKYGHGRINAKLAVIRAMEMMNHGNKSDNVDVPVLEKPEKPDDNFADDIDLQIIRITDPEELPGGPVRRLKTKVLFELSGAQKETFANSQSTYRVELYLIDSVTKELRFVGSDPDRQLQPQKFEYTSKLEFSRPMSGSYKLSSNVIINHPTGEIRATKRGLTLKIT